jgi:hypothetical protein
VVIGDRGGDLRRGRRLAASRVGRRARTGVGREQRRAPREPVGELPRAASLGELERGARLSAGRERAEDPRHARIPLVDLEDAGLVGEEAQLAVAQARAPAIELVPRRRCLARRARQRPAPGVDLGQAEARVVAARVIRGVQRAEIAPVRSFGGREVASEERELSVVVRELGVPLRDAGLPRERASVRQRPFGGAPVALAHRDEREVPQLGELLARLVGPPVEVEHLERLPPRPREVAGAERDPDQLLAVDHHAAGIA